MFRTNSSDLNTHIKSNTTPCVEGTSINQCRYIIQCGPKRGTRCPKQIKEDGLCETCLIKKYWMKPTLENKP